MNNLISVSVDTNYGDEVLFSSRMVAEATGKTHDNVKRDVKVMLKDLGLEISSDSERFIVKYKDYNGRHVIDEILVDKDIYEALLLKYTLKWRNHGLRENAALATIEQLLGVKLLRQYRVLGKYRIDGYDPVNNIAYEIDEEQHLTMSNIKADRIREEEIREELGCKFVRIYV